MFGDGKWEGPWAELYQSGRVFDVVLAAIAVELVILLLVRQRSGLRVADVAGQLAAGALLVLAVRAAVTGASPGAVLLLVTLSLPAHLADVYLRTRRGHGR